MPKILVVEDDEILRGQIASYLEHQRNTVETAEDGQDADDLLQACKYDLIILDWELPRMSGPQILQSFRTRGGVTPVLMLTGKSQIKDKAEGFDAGADDYLTKPFDVRELSMRVTALLRRPREFVGTLMAAGGIEVNTSEHRAFYKSQLLSLQPKEFDLLEFLVRHKGKVVRTQELLEHVWSSDSSVTSETLYTYVRGLRKKIETAGGSTTLIRTVHGIGYTIDAADS